MRQQLLGVFAAVVAVSLVTGCVSRDPNWVTPPEGVKQAPTFSISNNVLNPKYAVDQAVSTTSGTVNAKLGTEVLLTISALNSVTGVKSLDIEVTDPGGLSTSRHVDGTPNASGQYPTALIAIGTNPGSPDDKPFRVAVVLPGKVVVSATSSDGSTSSISLDYIPWLEPEVQFQASPLNIPSGGMSTLSWNTAWAQTLLLDGATVSAMNSKPVFPLSTTKYVMFAENPFWKVTREVTVNTGIGASLTITYRNPSPQPDEFDRPVTVRFNGVATGLAPASTPGELTFMRPVTTTIARGQPWEVTTTVNGLLPVQWTVLTSVDTYPTVACSAFLPASLVAVQGVGC